jgi:hypothetical protein
VIAIPRPRAIARGFVLGLVLLNAACGGAPPPQETPATVETPPPPPKDVTELARTVAQAKIGDHPIGKRLARLPQLASVFEGTGLDPLKDASTVFVASTGITRDDKAVVVVRYTVTPEKMKSAIDTAIERSEPAGEWLTETKTPAARVHVRSHERVLVMADPDLLVVLQGDLADQVDAFAGPLVLPVPDGEEAVLAHIEEPSVSLRAHGAPPIPPTLAHAKVRVLLRPDGGAVVHADAQSTTEAQAEVDAEALTRSVERATTVKVSFLRVRFFRPVVFRSEGDHVKAEVAMSADEVNKLLSMVEILGQR